MGRLGPGSPGEPERSHGPGDLQGLSAFSIPSALIRLFRNSEERGRPWRVVLGQALHYRLRRVEPLGESAVETRALDIRAVGLGTDATVRRVEPLGESAVETRALDMPALGLRPSKLSLPPPRLPGFSR
jgi:hypothetical protein